jgi:hypothetical protein
MDLEDETAKALGDVLLVRCLVQFLGAGLH